MNSENLTSALIIAMDNQDFQAFSICFEGLGIRRAKSLLKNLEDNYPKLFEKYIKACCKKFHDEDTIFDHHVIFKFMLLNAGYLTKLDSSMFDKHFTKRVVETYLDTKLLPTITNALKNLEPNELWRNIHRFPRPYLYSRFEGYLIEDFNKFIIFCANNYTIPDNFSILLFTSYCLTGVEEISYARHVAKHVENLEVLKSEYKRLKLIKLNEIPIIDFKQDVWTIVTKKGVQRLYKEKVSFESLSESLKEKLKSYTKYRMENNISINKLPHDILM